MFSRLRFAVAALAFLGLSSAAHAAVVSTGTLSIGDSYSDTVNFKGAVYNRYAMKVDQDSTVNVTLTGLTSTIKNIADYFKTSGAVGVGTQYKDSTVAGDIASIAFSFSALAGKTYFSDIAAFTYLKNQTGSVDFGVTVTPVPAALALFAPALAGLGYVGMRRRQSRAAA